MATEKQLIEANDVYALFDANGMARLHVGDIDVIPRVDAMEVTRCEYCIHSLNDGWICGGSGFTMPSHPTYPDAFCSYGEKKNDGC